MTDLLENTTSGVDAPAAPAAPVTFSSPPPAFPPPAGADTDDGRRLKLLALVAAVALGAAVIMGLLWMSASGARSNAESARDAALADNEASANQVTTLTDELADVGADLATAQTTNEALTAERDAVTATLESDTADVSQLRTQVGDLTANNEQMASQIAALTDELADAQAALDDAVEASAESDAAEAFDIAANPDFARYIGETLSSRSGSSRLGQAQSECFGTALVNDIGLDGLGRGLTLSASAADNNNVVGAMQRAAGTCNIDLSLIF